MLLLDFTSHQHCITVEVILRLSSIIGGGSDIPALLVKEATFQHYWWRKRHSSIIGEGSDFPALLVKKATFQPALLVEEATFQHYWWWKTSGALSCGISGTNGRLSKTTDVPYFFSQKTCCLNMCVYLIYEKVAANNFCKTSLSRVNLFGF
jgi:hypothetical protein